jgi:hypothetical protein
MDHGWRARGDCSEHCRHKPSSYLRKLWLDTLVFDRDQLDSLVRTHGADKLCLGTDYPFDMSEPDPLGFHERLSEENKAKILGLNAAHLLGLERGGVSDGLASIGEFGPAWLVETTGGGDVSGIDAEFDRELAKIVEGKDIMP